MIQFLAMAVMFGPTLGLTAVAFRNALRERNDE